jgi:hypothetical protein
MTARTLALGAVGLLALGAVCGILAYRSLTTPRVQIVNTPGNVQTVYVDRPVIQTKDVVRVVVDKAEATKMMAAAEADHQTITTLSETIAVLKAKGEGKIEYRDRLVPGDTVVRKEAHFSDFRLTFDAVDDKATYSLLQRFEVLSAVGKSAETDTVTKVVSATPDAPRWHFRASVTAGFGYAGGLNGLSPGGVVGLRWMTYGSTPAAEDGRWSVATPVLWLDSKVQQIGLLPISVNLGQIPKQPFRDLWLSPFIGLQPQPLGVGKFGFVLHATF